MPAPRRAAKSSARSLRNFISLQKEASGQAREFLLLISTCFDSCVIVSGFVCLTLSTPLTLPGVETHPA